MIRIRLDEKDFATLINGGEVEQQGVKIILADIGFDVMLYNINIAILNALKNRLTSNKEKEEGTNL